MWKIQIQHFVFQLFWINLPNCLQQSTLMHMCRLQPYQLPPIRDRLLCLGGLGRIDSTAWLLLPIQEKSKGLVKGWDDVITVVTRDGKLFERDATLKLFC